MSRYWIVLCVLGLFAGAVAPVQAFQGANRSASEEQTLSITADQRSETVRTIAKEFDERYVFPEVAAKVKKSLLENLEQNKYDSIATGQELAKRLTSELQAISKDKHVRVNCSTEARPKRGAEQKPTAAEQEERMERMRSFNGAFMKLERLPGNIGYLRLDGFMDPEAGKEPLQAAMQFLKNTDAMIIDLRYNGGGTPLMIRELCSYFFDEKPVHLNSMFFRKGNRTEEFWTNKEVVGTRYLNKEVYLLTSAFTFSGAEECAYNFQTQKRGTIVGERTGGGAHPGGTVPIGEHFMIFIPTGRAINPITKTNWEGVGVKPDVEVNADKALELAQELAVKKLLESSNKKVSQRVKMDLEQQTRMNKGIEERRQETLKARQAKSEGS